MKKGLLLPLSLVCLLTLVGCGKKKVTPSESQTSEQDSSIVEPSEEESIPAPVSEEESEEESLVPSEAESEEESLVPSEAESEEESLVPSEEPVSEPGSELPVSEQGSEELPPESELGPGSEELPVSEGSEVLPPESEPGSELPVSEEESELPGSEEESEPAIDYSITIKNKDDMRAEWVVGDADRALSLEIEPAGNITKLINDGEITFESSDEDVATIIGKNVHAVGAGTATITVSYHDATDFVDVEITAKVTNKEKFGTDHEGTADDPFTNEDALKAGAWLKDNGGFTTEKFYVTGVVSSFYHAPGARPDGAVSFYLQPATEGGAKFEVYLCFKDTSNTPLTDDDIWVGGTVVAYGAFTYYDGSNQYETKSAVLVSCEGNKPEARQTIDATFAEVLDVNAALADGADTYDYYKFQGYVTAKSGSNFFLTATKGEELVQASADDAHGGSSKKYYSNAFELYNVKDADLLAILLEGALVEVTTIVKNYHGQAENLLALTADDVTVVEAGEAWKVPEPAVTTKTLAEFIALENSAAKAYNVTAEIKSFKDGETKDKYGNMVLTDGENDLVIYGSTMTASALAWDNASAYAFTNPQDFLTTEATNALAIGDSVTMKLIRADYNGTVQGKGVITAIIPQGSGGGESENVTATFAAVDMIADPDASYTGGSVKFTSKALDEVVTLAVSATDGNSGKIYKSNDYGFQIRLYNSGTASLTATLAEGYEIVSATINYAVYTGSWWGEPADGNMTIAGDKASATLACDGSNLAVYSVTIVYKAAEGGEEPPVEELPLPVGNFSGHVNIESADTFVVLALANEKAYVRIGDAVKLTTTYTYAKATGLVTIDLEDVRYGNLTATYDPDANALVNVGVDGPAAAVLENNGALTLGAAPVYFNCDGTTDELREQFQRRYRTTSTGWTVDNNEDHTDRIMRDETNFVGGTGAMSVRPYGGTNNVVGLSMLNDLETATAYKNIGFWVYNSSENDITLRTWVYNSTGLSGAQEIGNLTAKAGGWTYCCMGFNYGAIYNFNISNWNGSANALVFDDICLF
ncbi:MAG: hypothetical protein IJQ67_03540 [Bacilli bacterium]|nr:hypothetical protein [Bacilli bacterium]